MEKAKLDVTTALQQGLLSVKSRLKIAGDVANGLKAIHEAHYIHQDIKADSILVSCQGKCTLGQVKKKKRFSSPPASFFSAASFLLFFISNVFMSKNKQASLAKPIAAVYTPK